MTDTQIQMARFGYRYTEGPAGMPKMKRTPRHLFPWRDPELPRKEQLRLRRLGQHARTAGFTPSSRLMKRT